MTEETQNAETEMATLPEAALAYLNAIEDSLSILGSHLANNEKAEAEEMLALITSQTTEFRTLLLAELS